MNNSPGFIIAYPPFVSLWSNGLRHRARLANEDRRLPDNLHPIPAGEQVLEQQGVKREQSASKNDR
jgi:hypothetical protein